MANEKVIITISTLNGQELTVGTRARSNDAPRQVDLFVDAEESASPPAVEVSEAPADSVRSALEAAPQAAVIPTSDPAPKVAETPAEAAKTPPEAATPAVATKKPWQDLSRGSKSMNFQPDPELYAKMMWCKENVPMMSLLRILRDGAMAECDRLIALHYKE